MRPPAVPPRRKATLSLPVDLRAILARVSAETGIPMSRLVEQGIRMRLVQIGALPAEQPATVAA